MRCELCSCDLDEATAVSHGEFFVCEACDAPYVAPTDEDMRAAEAEVRASAEFMAHAAILRQGRG